MNRPVTSFTEEYSRDVIATLFVETITWWLEHGRPCSEQEMAGRTGSLAFTVFMEINSW